MSEANTQDHIYTNHVSDEEGGHDECVYSNREDRYRIPVTELQNVINEKQKDDGFLKEYEVRSSVILVLPLFSCYGTNTIMNDSIDILYSVICVLPHSTDF